jgi:hypothetical protein
MGPVAEVNAAFQQRFHGNIRHSILLCVFPPLPSSLHPAVFILQHANASQEACVLNYALFPEPTEYIMELIIRPGIYEMSLSEV